MGSKNRLKSRLEWGLVADVHMPMLETKVAILKKKAELQNEVVTDEVAHFIAKHVFSSIRELEGALIRVLAFAALTKQPLTVSLVEKVLGHMVDSVQKVIEFEDVASLIQKHFSYSLKELRSKNEIKKSV